MNRKTIKELEQKIKDKKLDIELSDYDIREFDRIRTALLKGRLVLTHRSGMQWDVGYIRNNKYVGISYWHKRLLQDYNVLRSSQYISVSCYGTSRPLEIILGFGYNLGLTFDKINQSQQVV